MPGVLFSILIIYLSSHPAHQDVTAGAETSEPNDHYDFIVFAQMWPITKCKSWIHESNGNECLYPHVNKRWLIHGIWPTVLDWNPHSPSFCRNSSVFDPEQIKSIESELEHEWANLYKGTDQYIFWGYEWMKHGTCATDLEPVSTQFKYFRKGIEWKKEYSIIDMFNAVQIIPDDNKEFAVRELATAVKAKTGKNPMVSCYTMDQLQYVEEMRICFDKRLTVIDCDPIAHKKCDVSKGIILPANT